MYGQSACIDYAGVGGGVGGNTLFSSSGGVDRVVGLGWEGDIFGMEGIGGFGYGGFFPVVCGVGLD